MSPSGEVSHRRVGFGFVRQGSAEVAVETQHLAGLGQRVEHHATQDGRADRVQLKLERCGHAEVPATATQRPEQVGVLAFAGGHELAIGGHQVDGEQVVAGEAVLAHQPAEAAAERQTADAGVGHGTAGRGEPEGLGLAVKLAPEHAALRLDRAGGGVDAGGLHQGQVDHQATVAGGKASRAVAAAADGDQEFVLAREIDRLDDVGHPGALGDQAGALVDHPVPELARRIVARVMRTQQRTAQTGSKSINGGGVQHDRGAPVHRGLQVGHRGLLSGESRGMQIPCPSWASRRAASHQ